MNGIPTKTIVILSSIILMSNNSTSSIINGSHLRSLSCLGKEQAKGNCRVLGRVMALPDKILEIYRNQGPKIKEALDSGNLTVLNSYELTQIHPMLLILVPMEALSRVNGDKLALLLTHWSKDKAIARLIITAAFYNNNAISFIKRLQNFDLQNNILDMVGEDLSLERSPKELGPLIAHLPYYLFFNIPEFRKSKLLSYLKSWYNDDWIKWNSKSHSIHRAWARLLIEANYPKPLSDWNDLDFENVGGFLIGARISELNSFKGNLIIDKMRIFKNNFSILQVRSLFNNFFNVTHFSRRDFYELENVLAKLLPSQLQNFPFKVTNFKNSDLQLSSKSTAAAKQMLQYLLVEEIINRKLYSHETNENKLIQYGHMTHLMPPSLMQELKMNELISFDKLRPLQSNQLSPLQVFIITDKGKSINVSNEEIKHSFIYLHSLSTNQINMDFDSSLIMHLALHMPFDNLPRLIKFLRISQIEGRSDVLLKLLQNPSRLKMFDMFPARIFYSKTEKLADVLGALPNESRNSWTFLPTNLALLMYRNYDSTELNPSRSSISLKDHLIYGITCQDIIDLPISDYITTMSRYRKIISIKNIEFPKNLQHCSAEKLVEYLRLKSYIIQRYFNDGLIGLLTPVEIEAVGGWILLSLPVDEVIQSEYFNEIIRQIGHMSISELLLAAPLPKIRLLIDAFLQDKMKNQLIGLNNLYKLGNLMMLFDENMISKIDAISFKILLENRNLDIRLCVTQAEKKAWKELTLLAFGNSTKWTGDDLEVLNDMLIVIPKKILSDINPSVWIEVIDLLDSKYLDSVQYYKEAAFYQMCLDIIPISERESYIESIQNLIKYYLHAAQWQLDTVVSSKELLKDHHDSKFNNSQEEVQDSTEIISLNSIHTQSKEVVSVSFKTVDSSTKSWSEELMEGSDEYTDIESNELDSLDSKPEKDGLDVSSYNSTYSSINDYKKIDIRTEIPPIHNIDNYDTTIKSEIITSTVLVNHINNFKDYDYHNNRSDPCNNKTCNHIENTADKLNNIATTELISPFTDDSEALEMKMNLTISKLSETDESYKTFISLINNTSEPNIPENTTKKLEKVFSKDINNDEHIKPIVENYSDKIESNNGSSTDLKSIETSDNGIHNDLFSALNEILTNINNSNTRLEYNNEEYDDLLESVEHHDNPNNEMIITTDNNHAIFNEEFPPFAKAVHTMLSEINKTEGRTEIDLSHETLLPESEVKLLTKRSAETKNTYTKVSCDALKSVGKSAALIITADIIAQMTDDELMDCSENFASLNLPHDIVNSIWFRLDKSDLHLKGRLTAAASRDDLKYLDMNLTNPWALENIYTLSRNNKDPYVAHKIIDQVVQNKKQLQIEEVIAFGDMLCLLPDLDELISPEILLISAVILGSTLSCNLPCLNKIVTIAMNEDAFGKTDNWSSIDVNDLGIIIAGLTIEDWKLLIDSNPNALYGLKEPSGICLPESHIQITQPKDIAKIPYFTKQLIKEHLKSESISLEQLQALELQPDISLEDEHNTYSSSESNHTNLRTILFILLSSKTLLCYFYSA